jgi:3',5'-cyclic AMP phosphodiesterase CpdA
MSAGRRQRPAPPLITRRTALAGAAALPLALAACGGGSAGTGAARSGSTLQSTWVDRDGNGQLRVGPGERLADRTELGEPAAPGPELALLAHVTDAHVLDASSPARVTFLDRLGPPFQSTFRPQEALTVPVLAGALRAVRALGPQLLIQGGDLIDNVQANELEHGLGTLHGGRVHPGSGPRGYDGVQSATNTDPFYYRPDVDAPRHPGLLQAAVRPFTSPGAGVPVLPVLGDHDALVAGELVPTALTRELAVGDRALWELPAGLTLPPGVSAGAIASPDGPPDPGQVDAFLRQALAGPTVPVPADRARRELSFSEVTGRLGAAGPGLARDAAASAALDYVFDAGPHLRLIVADVVRRGGGSGGEVTGDQPAWVERQLAMAGERWVIFVSHQPLTDSAGGTVLLDILDRSPRVIAALSGHTHHNRIQARPTAAGGYWLISTASLIDYPQQARALRVLATAQGGVAIQTWMLDHVEPEGLGSISRELSYLDAEGGRPGRFAGLHADRNVTLYRRPPANP